MSDAQCYRCEQSRIKECKRCSEQNDKQLQAEKARADKTEAELKDAQDKIVQLSIDREEETDLLKARVAELEEKLRLANISAERNFKAKTAARAKVNALVGALEIALHDLTTSHNLLATDRPDLVDLNNIISRGRAKMEPIKTASGKDLMWMIDNSRAIDIVTKALAKAKEGDK